MRDIREINKFTFTGKQLSREFDKHHNTGFTHGLISGVTIGVAAMFVNGTFLVEKFHLDMNLLFSKEVLLKVLIGALVVNVVAFIKFRKASVDIETEHKPE